MPWAASEHFAGGQLCGCASNPRRGYRGRSRVAPGRAGPCLRNSKLPCRAAFEVESSGPHLVRGIHTAQRQRQADPWRSSNTVSRQRASPRIVTTAGHRGRRFSLAARSYRCDLDASPPIRTGPSWKTTSSPWAATRYRARGCLPCSGPNCRSMKLRRISPRSSTRQRFPVNPGCREKSASRRDTV